MSSDSIRVRYFNDVYNHIICEPGLAQEISDHFTFMVPGYKFMPAYKGGWWDGKIRLFDTRERTLYSGLTRKLEEFCKSRDYEFIDETAGQDEFSLKEAKDFVDTIGLPSDKYPRDYQFDAFVHAVRHKRAILLSPTASGKSLIIYLIQRYLNRKTLLIVPTIGLVGQMYSDFEEYGFDSEKHCHMIHGGTVKNTDKRVVISTWQSIYKMPQKWFDQFDVIIGDEAHQFKATALKGIMEKTPDCPYKFGLTGTLDDVLTNELTLIGLFGPVRVVAKTSELIDKKQLAELFINIITLKYDDETRKLGSKLKYNDEIEFLINNEKRNKFITNLTLSIDGNVLVLFNRREHGKTLHEMILRKTNRPVYFIDGSVGKDERNEIRAILEKESDAILIASSGTTSTGTNIVRLNACIFAFPTKAKIRVLQSIGRILRKSMLKEQATLYDIADDLSWKSKKNYTFLHLLERVKTYTKEQFKYKMYNVNVK